jgi:hypothetical protein
MHPQSSPSSAIHRSADGKFDGLACAWSFNAICHHYRRMQKRTDIPNTNATRAQILIITCASDRPSRENPSLRVIPGSPSTVPKVNSYP